MTAAPPELEPEPEPEPPVAAVGGDGDEGWTLEEQSRLEEALKCFGKDLGQERWVQVAGPVESRTAAECKARFRKLVKVSTQSILTIM